MCGIAGLINFNNKTVEIEQLVKMKNIIGHRGPDDWGIALFNMEQKQGFSNVIEYKAHEPDRPMTIDPKANYCIGLAHTRLSIIDLSERGHQPMSNQDGSLWIVYNGEIYNYIEIRNDLMSLGYNFKSNTDTEVILYAYKEWGIDCLKRFNGMWAFVILDRKENVLFCARDRFGIKPFYYYLDSKVFIFASEIKQILEFDEYNKGPNEKLIYDYLVIGFEDHTNETFFDNIFKIGGGEYGIIHLKDGTFRKHRFYNLNERCLISHEKHEYYDYFRQLFIDSVNIRLRSDVPVGSSLSGGLDSSAVVSIGSTLLKKHGKKSFNTYTACWLNEAVDERKYAESVIKYTGAKGNYIYPTPDNLVEDLPKLIWHQEEPFGSLSIFAQWAVMKAAHQDGTSVLLDGQGGDEVFLGYEKYYAWFLMELLKKGYFKNFIREFRKSSENSKMTTLEILLYYFYFNFNRIRALRLRQRAACFINSDFMKSYDIMDRVNICKRNNDILNLQINEIQINPLSSLLKYADRNSMAFSIEVRLPLLDYRLVEFALSVPGEYKIRDGWTKNIMREGLKNSLPEEIRLRKNKIGFEVPQANLIKFILPHWKESINNNSILKKYFNEAWLNKTSKNNNFDHRITWKAMCLDLWFQRFFHHKGN